MHSQDGICKKTRKMQHSPLKVSPCQALSSTARSGSPTAGSSQSPETVDLVTQVSQGQSENWPVSLTGSFPTSWYEAIAELLHTSPCMTWI